MKTNKLILIFALFTTNLFIGQVSHVENDNLKFNSTSNCKLRYLYYPNLQAYYDKLNRVYWYKEKGEWIESEELPENYGGYSLFSKMCVEIKNYDDDLPYTQIDYHKKQFPYNAKGHINLATASNE
jgi:hypothetical protein